MTANVRLVLFSVLLVVLGVAFLALGWTALFGITLAVLGVVAGFTVREVMREPEVDSDPGMFEPATGYGRWVAHEGLDLDAPYWVDRIPDRVRNDPEFRELYGHQEPVCAFCKKPFDEVFTPEIDYGSGLAFHEHCRDNGRMKFGT